MKAGTILALAVMICLGAGPASQPTTQPATQQTDGMQDQRRELIGKLIGEGVFQNDLSDRGKDSSISAGPKFASLSFEMKQKFCGVVFAYVLADNPKMEMLHIKDYSNGKRIGYYSKVGLTLK